MTSTTIKSNTTIEYNNILKVAQQARDAMFEFAETKSTITYRRMSLPNDNLSGDIDKTGYTTYNLDAIVVFLLIDDRIVQQGEMKPGDSELFIKPYINHESDGTIITEPFEPQIDDEFLFQGIRFRIKLIRTERIGNTKVFLDCLASRMENNNPIEEWNTNYRAVDSDSRRGSGWD